MQKTLIAMYVEIALRSAFGDALFNPRQDASLTMVFAPRSLGEFKIYSGIAHAIPQSYERHASTGATAFHQNNRPVRQPHCARAANAVKKEKAAQRDLSRGLNNE